MNVSQIIKKKNCMLCGTCVSMCPKSAVNLAFDYKTGFWRVNINETACVNCGLCIKSCPVLHQDNSSYLNEYKDLYLAHVCNENVRYAATSGGVINSLVNYLVINDYVEAVLLVIHDCSSPIESSAIVINKDSIKQLNSQPREFASRYVLVPVLAKLKEVLGLYKKIAVVGTPCQIKALSIFADNNNLGSYIYKIGITCSGGMSYLATAEYKRKMNMKNSYIYYRGNGWPGCNSLIERDNKFECAHSGSLFERMFSSQIFKNQGCRECKDHFAELADISFCDYWNKEERDKEKIGNSCVIIRTERAQQIFNSMINDKYIEVVKRLDETSVIDSQMPIIKVKKSNLQHNRKLQLFYFICNTVFRLKLYSIFNYKMYDRFCNLYLRICNRI